MKRWISLLLALCMALSLSLSFAESAETWTEESLEAAADIRTSVAGDYTGKTIILHSNDVHGQLDGYATIAGLRNYFKELGATVILADAGDFSQGSIYVSAMKGATAVEVMNAAGYDVVTMGNHEFNHGFPQLLENLAPAKFSVVCASITLDETGETVWPATKIIETESGLKIGFFGLTTPETVTKVNPRLIGMLTFASFNKLYESAQAAIDEIRDEADLVIGLTHLGVDKESQANGYRSVDLLEKVTGVDMLLDGHSHTVMTAGPKGEMIQSTGTKFAYVGVVVIDDESRTIEDHFLLPTFLGSDLYMLQQQDAETLAAADLLIAAVDAIYGKTFATSEVLLNGERAPGNRTEETNLGDLTTDAMVWYVTKEGGPEQVEPNDIAGITNGGSIRASIEKGEVTMRDIKTVLPFLNTVTVVYVTGAELLEAMEAATFCTPEPIGAFPQTSGIEWTLDMTKAFDQGPIYMLDGKETSYYAPASINRVTITKINGEPFDVNKTYAIVTSNFAADGGDAYNVFANNESRFDTGIPIEDAVIAYVQDVLGGVIGEEYAAPQGRETEIK